MRPGTIVPENQFEEEKEEEDELMYMQNIDDRETDINSVYPDVALLEDNIIQIGMIDVDTV